MSTRQTAAADIAQQLAQFAQQLMNLQGEIVILRNDNAQLTTNLGTLCAENTTLAQSNSMLQGQVGMLQANATQAAQALTRVQAAKQQAAAPAAGNVLQPAAPVIFAATPVMVRHEDLIDYKAKAGVMIYEEGYAALTSTFDMKSSGTVVYITELQAKCTKMGWSTGTQQITHFVNADSATINVINQYGQLDIALLRTKCESFCKAGGAQFEKRARQNNTMMGECILATLTPAARIRLLPFCRKYKINDVVYAPLLHKKVMALATIDSVATTKTLRANLQELPTYCASVKGDIEMVHSYFDSNYSQIIAHGATVNDPVDILFSAYAAVPCHNFRTYIRRKHDLYTNGSLTITHEELIPIATNKFNLLKQEGSWGAKSANEEQIIAMQAELSALKGQFALGPNLKKAACKGHGKNDKGQDGKREKKGQNKKNTSNRRAQKQDEAWKKITPKSGKPKEKEVRGKKFYWCHHHMAWGVHKPADCRVGQAQKDNKDAHQKKKVTAQAALATVIAPEWAALVANMTRNMADE
jgi:hypothetical protein